MSRHVSLPRHSPLVEVPDRATGSWRAIRPRTWRRSNGAEPDPDHRNPRLRLLPRQLHLQVRQQVRHLRGKSGRGYDRGTGCGSHPAAR